jgi:DNA polymerase-3 subunit beta
MKFIALRSNVKEALTIVEKVTGDNLNLPILKNILIETHNGGIRFVATNLEIAITHNVSGKVIEDGTITVPAGLLSSLITNLQSDRLNFEKKGNNLEIKTDNYNAVIQGIPSDDFPITPKIKNTENYLEIKGVLLKEAVQQVAAASQFSDLRPELNSILFNFSIENLKLAATDGFRLAERTIPATLLGIKGIDEPFQILVPLKTSQEVLRVVKDDDLVCVFRDENQVLFKTESTELISRIIDGNFPDYSQLISNKFAVEISINKEEFLNAIKLAGIFGQKNSEVRIMVHDNKKIIEISSADQSLGENNYLLPAKIKGEKTEVFFNWRYLASALRAVKTEDVFIGLAEEVNPALIKSTSDNSYFYILRPIMRS